MNGWFSKHKWTKRMQNGGFPFVYYWKSEHSSIFKAEVSEHDAKCRIFAGLLLEKWSLVDFQSMRERTWCKMGDFRGFTIVKVIISRFSKHTWAKMMQNGGCSRFYYCKREHWPIFKAYVNANDAKWRIFAVLLLEKWSLVDFQSIRQRKSRKMPEPPPRNLTSNIMGAIFKKMAVFSR